MEKTIKVLLSKTPSLSGIISYKVYEAPPYLEEDEWIDRPEYFLNDPAKELGNTFYSDVQKIFLDDKLYYDFSSRYHLLSQSHSDKELRRFWKEGVYLYLISIESIK